MRATQTSGKVNQSSITKRFKNPTLKRVLSYHNSDVVEKMSKEYKISMDDAELLFQDLLKFLWLGSKFGRVTPPKLVDDGWHIFLLFTMEYQKFCYKYFGRFIHHQPWVARNATRNEVTFNNSKAIVAEHLGDNLSSNWVYHMEGDIGCTSLGNQKWCENRCESTCDRVR